MPVLPKTPIVIPEKQLNKLWLKKIFIDSPIVGGATRATIIMVPYCDQSLDAGFEETVININDVNELISAGHTKIAAAVVAIQEAVQSIIDAEE